MDLWKVDIFGSPEEVRIAMQKPDPKCVRIGMITATGDHILSRSRKDGDLDVPVLHDEVVTGLLKVSEEAVRDESHITYVRGIDAAVAEVRQKNAQVAFLLDPTPIESVARVAFGGGVMPQKSTDFFPKLLSGGEIKYAYMGVSTTTSPNNDGAVVAAITADGPAAGSGLRQGDKIIAVAGKKISEPGDLSTAVLEHKPGEKVSLTVVRSGDQRTIEVQLGTRPDQLQQG